MREAIEFFDKGGNLIRYLVEDDSESWPRVYLTDKNPGGQRVPRTFGNKQALINYLKNQRSWDTEKPKRKGVGGL